MRFTTVLTPARRLRRFAVTHLYIAAFTLVWVTAAPGQPARELLNSERIATVFGSYGVEVLEQDDAVRVSNLYSGDGADRTCRTFAVVRYASTVDPAVRAEHAAIVAGGSLGAVFEAAGWEVRKTHLSYGQRAASARLAALMQVDAGAALAEHVYVLDVEKDGRTVEYAALVEIHHPDYLKVAQLAAIYGPADERRPELVAALRAAADERVR